MQDGKSMTNYTLGFSINHDSNLILLVKKKFGPDFNIGKLNGLGGKLEKGESSVQCMRREFREEAGLDIEEKDWYNFGDIFDGNNIVSLFKTDIFPDNIQETNDVGEPLSVVSINDALYPEETSLYAQNIPTIISHALTGYGYLEIII